MLVNSVAISLPSATPQIFQMEVNSETQTLSQTQPQRFGASRNDMSGNRRYTSFRMDLRWAWTHPVSRLTWINLSKNTTSVKRESVILPQQHKTYRHRLRYMIMLSTKYWMTAVGEFTTQEIWIQLWKQSWKVVQNRFSHTCTQSMATVSQIYYKLNMMYSSWSLVPLENSKDLKQTIYSTVMKQERAFLIAWFPVLQ